MICLICLDEIERSGVTNCIHHFCFKCIMEYMYSTQNSSCPKCRAPIYSVDLDPEFDGSITERRVLTSVPSKPSPGSMCVVCEDVNVIPGGKIGITLSKGVLGLHVLKVNPDSDSYRCGLRKGDAILSINNIPFRSHSQAIRCINNSSEQGKVIRFRIVRKPDLRV